MDDVTLTPESILVAVEAAVQAEGEDYIYTPVGEDPRCVYVHDDKPSCIVGRVLVSHGVPLERLAEFDRTGFEAGGVTAEVVVDMLRAEGATVKGINVGFYLSELQDMQDHGHPWGHVLTKARRLFGK